VVGWDDGLVFALNWHRTGEGSGIEHGGVGGVSRGHPPLPSLGVYVGATPVYKSIFLFLGGVK